MRSLAEPEVAVSGGLSRKPSLRVERSLQRSGHHLLAGMDEVGRGALAGPVSVGVVVIDPSCRSAPTGVKDSKLLTPLARRRLVPPIRRWAMAFAIGHASPAEIDRIGIIAALRLAGTRALGALPVIPDLVILDGNHDWLTDPARAGLFALSDPQGLEPGLAVTAPPVRTMIKADMKCSTVAAASVLAKVERDAMMVELARTVPTYGWELNKGYSCPEHFAALRSYGPSEHHRRSWRLPQQGEELSGPQSAGPRSAGPPRRGLPPEEIRRADATFRSESTRPRAAYPSYALDGADPFEPERFDEL